MSVEKARAHYIGKDGFAKLNCAQAILTAYKDRFNLSQEAVDKCGACGKGGAPGGECGALYAARVIFGSAHPAQAKACEDALLAAGGSTRCAEIRATRKLSCVGCVTTIAACIEKT